MTNDANTENFENFVRDLVELGDAQTPAMSGIDVMMAMGRGTASDELDRAVNELTMTHFGFPVTDSLVDDIVEELDGMGDNFND